MPIRLLMTKSKFNFQMKNTDKYLTELSYYNKAFVYFNIRMKKFAMSSIPSGTAVENFRIEQRANIGVIQYAIYSGIFAGPFTSKFC